MIKLSKKSKNRGLFWQLSNLLWTIVLEHDRWMSFRRREANSYTMYKTYVLLF